MPLASLARAILLRDSISFISTFPSVVRGPHTPRVQREPVVKGTRNSAGLASEAKAPGVSKRVVKKGKSPRKQRRRMPLSLATTVYQNVTREMEEGGDGEKGEKTPKKETHVVTLRVGSSLRDVFMSNAREM